MADYFFYNGQMYKTDVLKHYGVLGMKWGVRRGRADKAYAKASKKLNKLENKVEKLQGKAKKKLAKAERAKYGFSLRDPNRAAQKAGKAQYKVDKKMKKAIKWLDKMEKAFKDTNVQVTNKQQSLGKKYVEELRKSEKIKLSIL